jgi:alkaline phosphatase D
LSIRGNWERRRVEAVSRLGEMDRRNFVKLAGASAAALVFGAGPFTEKVWAQPTFSAYPFSLGVASGDPLTVRRTDGVADASVVLWTRLAPNPLIEGGGMPPNSSVQLQWQVADDEAFRSVVKQGSVMADPKMAHSVHVEVGGLQAAREYFYRFTVPDGTGTVASPTGRTKTAPAPGASVARMAFAFVSCQMYEHGYYTAYRRMAEVENLDLVVHLGDYIYENGAGNYQAPGGNVRTHSGRETYSLWDYRNRHAQYKMDPDLQAAHKRFPWVVTWDDHEVDNNYADDIPTYSTTVAEFLGRRAAAYQAYYEHMPLRRSSVPSGPDMLLYRRLAYGKLAEFNVLDTRQYRSDQVTTDAQRKDPARTMTGATQETWLRDGLAAAQARGVTWKVLAQQTFFAQRDLDTSSSGRSYLMDAWDGYTASRDRILNHVRLSNPRIQNPVVLSGDVHNNWACDLKANFSNPYSQTLGVEFVGTSVTSGGDGADTGTT